MATRAAPAALHLHLDVAAGVRADALLGALLGVGAPRAALDDALTQLFGPGASVDVDKRRVQGALAVAARVHVPGLDDDPPGLTDDDAGRSTERAGAHRRRSRAYVRDQRRGSARVAVAEAMPLPAGPGGTGAGRADVGRASAPPEDVPARVERGLLPRWASGERARPAELTIAVRQSGLAPVTKALALRTTTALVEALGRVRGAVDEQVLEGAFALRALAHVAGACALVDALSPALVTSSVIGVRTRGADHEPSAWMDAVLEGAWVLEHDDGPASDVVGAALVRALASRFGARGLFSPIAQGFGVASVGDAPAPLLVRATTGRASPLGARAAEARLTPSVTLRATVDLACDRAALAAALFQAGALEVGAREVSDLRGQTLLALDVVGGPGAADALVVALWRAGAERVATSWTELRAPGVADVTVPVGRGRKKAAVRVRVARAEDGELLSVRALADDVREAARVTRRPEEVVRAEALQTWSAHEADRDGAGAAVDMDEGSEGDDE